MFVNLNLIEYYYYRRHVTSTSERCKNYKRCHSLPMMSQEKETFTEGVFSVRF